MRSLSRHFKLKVARTLVGTQQPRYLTSLSESPERAPHSSCREYKALTYVGHIDELCHHSYLSVLCNHVLARVPALDLYCQDDGERHSKEKE